jgi:hypothetical protein
MTRDELDLLALVLATTAALAGLPLTVLEIMDKALDIRAKLRRGRHKKSRATSRPASRRERKMRPGS